MEKIKKFLFTNQTTKQTVAKNTFWLFAGEILGRILKLGVVVFATRVLSVESWGIFSYALAFVSLFYVFGDIGINTFITREMSKRGADRYQYLSAALAVKLILLTFSFFASIILASYFKTMALDLNIIVILALLTFSDSIREFTLSVNRALERMEREAFIKILMNIIITTLGIMLLMQKANPLSLAIAYASGSIVASIVSIWALFSEFKHVSWKFSKETIKVILNFSWPFIAVSLFAAAMASIDTIMLGQMKSATEVGFYAAAQRLVQFLGIIPTFIAISIFPIMSKNESDPDAMTRVFEKIMVVVLGIGLPIAIGGFLLRQEIITLIFGAAYAPGGIVLGILMFSIFPFFPNIIFNNVIFAKNLQRKFIIATVAGFVANIFLNILLIPPYGAAGTAASVVLSHLLIMLINWHMLKKVFSFSIVPKLGKIIFTNIIIALIILLFNMIGVHFIATILIAVASYALILNILKEPTVAEMIAIIK